MPLYPDDADAASSLTCHTTGFRSISSITLEDLQVWREGDSKTAKVSYVQHKAE